jgi:hypothetical protein
MPLPLDMTPLTLRSPRTVSPCLRKCSITGALAANCKSPLDLKCVCGAGKNAYQGGAAPCIIA